MCGTLCWKFLQKNVEIDARRGQGHVSCGQVFAPVWGLSKGFWRSWILNWVQSRSSPGARSIPGLLRCEGKWGREQENNNEIESETELLKPETWSLPSSFCLTSHIQSQGKSHQLCLWSKPESSLSTLGNACGPTIRLIACCPWFPSCSCPCPLLLTAAGCQVYTCHPLGPSSVPFPLSQA